MKALIIGATGATGKDLVDVLLQDTDYADVVLFVRRESGKVHPKLTEIITDFDRLESVSEKIFGDVLFSCLGTTMKAAGSKDNQWHIDYELPLRFAEIARSKGVAKMVLISASGASAGSKIFYSRMKGELEDRIAILAFAHYFIFRPSLLLRKDTDRPVETISAGILNFLNGIGIARKYRPLPTSILAEKMAKAAKSRAVGTQIIELDKIFGY
jgi:uncharacterized protein YbjT (DUF2867 family)